MTKSVLSESGTFLPMHDWSVPCREKKRTGNVQDRDGFGEEKEEKEEKKKRTGNALIATVFGGSP